MPIVRRRARLGLFLITAAVLFAALLVPIEGGSLRLLGDACYLIDGNLSVRVTRKGRAIFIWKSREVEATPELLAELGRFSAEVSGLLLPVT